MPALVAGIHVLRPRKFKDVDGRNKSGHDERKALPSLRHARAQSFEEQRASHAYVVGIHVLRHRKFKDVDGRDRPGHDESHFQQNLTSASLRLRVA
jgi:hypothetical protein